MSGTAKDVDDDCHLPMIRYAYINEALISSLDDLVWLEIGKGLAPIRKLNAEGVGFSLNH